MTARLATVYDYFNFRRLQYQQYSDSDDEWFTRPGASTTKRITLNKYLGMLLRESAALIVFEDSGTLFGFGLLGATPQGITLYHTYFLEEYVYSFSKEELASGLEECIGVVPDMICFDSPRPNIVFKHIFEASPGEEKRRVVSNVSTRQAKLDSDAAEWLVTTMEQFKEKPCHLSENEAELLLNEYSRGLECSCEVYILTMIDKAGVQSPLKVK